MGIAAACLLTLGSVPALAAELSVSWLPQDPVAMASTAQDERQLEDGDRPSRVRSEDPADDVPTPLDEAGPATTEKPPRFREQATTVASAVIGASLSLGLGTWGARGLHGERWFATGTEALAGSLLGTLPGLMALELSPFTHSWGIDGPGAALGFLGTLGGLTLEVGGSTLGTWATGELAFGPSRSPWGALGGAFIGSLVGAVLGLAVDAMLAKVLPDPKAFRWSFSIGLVGSSATLGYQWLGGGPRRGP